MFICDIPRVIQVIFAFWGHSKQFNELFLKKIERSKNLKCLKKCSPRSGNVVKYVIRLTQHSCFIPRCSILSCMHIPTCHLSMFYLLLNIFHLLPWPLFFFRCHHLPILIWSFIGGKQDLQLTMVSFWVSKSVIFWMVFNTLSITCNPHEHNVCVKPRGACMCIYICICVCVCSFLSVF